MQNNRNGLFKFFRDSNLKFYNSRIKTPAYLDLEDYFPEYKILEENWTTNVFVDFSLALDFNNPNIQTP